MPSNSSAPASPLAASAPPVPQSLSDLCAWGVDFSTKGVWIGWRDSNGRGVWGQQVAEIDHVPMPRRLAALSVITSRVAATVAKDHPASHILVETPSNNSRPLSMAYGVVTQVLYIETQGEVEIWPCNNVEWKKAVLPSFPANRAAAKAASVAKALEWGFAVPDDHADAMCIAEFAYRAAE